MGGRIQTARDLLRRLTSEAPGTSSIVREGRRELLKNEGLNSIFAWPVLAIARKAKGKGLVQERLYEKFHRPLKNLDENLGRHLSERTGAKKMFKQVDVLPTRSNLGGHKTSIEHETHSATAPIKKLMDIATPLAAGAFALKAFGGEPKMAEDKNQLLKEAASALDQADRQTRAQKLAFTMVERGKIPPFHSFESFQEKVASIATNDLDVVQKALELDTGGSMELGKVAEERPSDSTDAHQRFYHRMTGE